jgi:hypothetical protein
MSPNISFYVSVSRTLMFFILSLYGFEGIYDCNSCSIKRDISIMLEMCVNILWFVSCGQNVQELYWKV